MIFAPTGTGMNLAAIAYVAVGVKFDAITDTLAAILFDNVHLLNV